eukprot:g32926.t1
MVDRVMVVPSLLYGSEMWTVYSQHLKTLEKYPQCCLCKILRTYWEDRCTNTSVLDQANIPSIEALITLNLLQWAGHTVRMTGMRLPKEVLYSQLRNSRRVPGGQRKRFSDTLKGSLVKCSIPTDTWESLAQDCPKWSRSIWE